MTSRASAARPGSRRDAAPGPTGPGERAGLDPAAAVLWAGLAALAVARAAATFAPSRALWGLDVQRDLGALAAWVPWSLAAAALVPGVARLLAPALERFGRAIGGAPWAAGLFAALLAVLLVGAFPDRLHYVGDFLLRIGAVRQEESPDVLSPQAFPLDVLAHYAAPLHAERAGWMSAEAAVRAIGALGAGLLAMVAVLFAGAIEVGPAARAAAFATVLFGGYLCLYTGESKAFAEMVIAVVAVAGFALSMLRGAAEARGAAGALPRAPGAGGTATRGAPGAGAVLGAGLSLGLGVLFHRFALGLVPAWLVAVLVWLGALRARALRSVAALLGFAVPLVVLGVMAPRIWSTVSAYDLGANFAAAAPVRPGALAGALDPAHLLDVLDLVLFLSPAAFVGLALALVPGLAGRRDAAPRGGRGEAAVMIALVAPFALVMLLARPPQGPLRDWDSLATPAAALSVGAAWSIARALARSRQAWLAAAVVLGVAAPAFQWLEHYADPARSRARLEALMTGPPARPALDRARTWDFLGWRYFREQRFDAAARAFERASTAAPSPSNLTHWAMAEAMRGRHDRALAIYEQAVDRDSNFTLGWFGVGVSAINSGNRAQASRAAGALTRLAPDNPKTREIVEWVGGAR